METDSTPAPIPATTVPAPEAPIPETASAVSIPEMVTADSLTGPLVEGFPGEKPTPPSESPKTDFPPDTLGRQFDPSKFKLRGDGFPRTNAKGEFIPLNVGRPAGVKSAPKAESTRPFTSPSTVADLGSEKPNTETGAASNSTPPLSEKSDSPEVKGVDAYDAAAEMYCRIGWGIACGAISDEWLPNKEEEKGIPMAVSAYLRAKGSVDLTPGQALALVLASYAIPRMTKPKTKQKLVILWVKVRSWFGNK